MTVTGTAPSDLSSLLTMAERADILSTNKVRVVDLENKREHLVRCGRALVAEIADTAYEVHGEKRENVRPHLEKNSAEEATLKSDVRCVELALTRARQTCSRD